MPDHQARDDSPRHAGSRFQWTKFAGDYLSIPILLAAVPTIASLFGWFLDRTFKTFPWLTIILLVLGFVGAGRELWMTVKRAESKNGKRETD